ncbi:MAG: HEAT repeat domain-containing protein [Cyclobacteriaceae bacterium]|jgi:HEAT repeat protein
MNTKRKVRNTSIYLNGIMFFILFFPFAGFSQSIPQQFQTYAEQLHQSQSVAAPSALREEKNAKEVIEIAHQYFSDTLSRVRAKMYSLVGEAGVNAKDKNLRQLAVEQLVNASADFENLDLLLSKLSAFNKSDFTQPSRDTIVTLFRKKPPYLDQLTRLVGSLQMTSLKDDLMVLSGPATSNQRIRWAALLALARMGDAEATQSLMKRVQRLPVNDDVVYEVFPDLIYTRQRQAIDYLIVELKNDEKKCTTADAEDETPITCAYRIMELLAPVIEKYPLEVDASGDIKTKDYKKSLATVRNWFEKNSDYKIVQRN